MYIEVTSQKLINFLQIQIFIKRKKGKLHKARSKFIMCVY